MAIQALKSIINIIVISLFIFPIEFVFLPGINSKMILAVCGVIAFLAHCIQTRSFGISKEYVILVIMACMVSLCGVISVSYNDTKDFTYASYLVSFAVWIAAAYFVVSIIRVNDGFITIRRLCYYLIAVAVAQCVLAIFLDLLTPFKDAVNSIVVGFASMHSAGAGLERAGRLYGIGAALDVAGTRFAPILAVLFMCVSEAYYENKRAKSYLMTLCFVFLFVVGSMISRTTIVGVIVALIIFILSKNKQKVAFSRYLFFSLLIAVVLSSVLYYQSSFFYENVRFAFEGFFNFFEHGEWTTGSTQTLETMYKFPESLKTIMIGDGYFNEPYYVDPYYIGEERHWGVFYMGTDVGYLRFIYYFGFVGLMTFMAYFVYATVLCSKRFPDNKWVFIILLMCNFIIWFKVATDIFCLFALFLCVPQEDESREGIDMIPNNSL